MPESFGSGIPVSTLTGSKICFWFYKPEEECRGRSLEPDKEYQDIKLESTEDGIAKITINRPEVRNAFRPQTVHELIDAFNICRKDQRVGVIVLTGEGKKHFALVEPKSTRSKRVILVRMAFRD